MIRVLEMHHVGGHRMRFVFPDGTVGERDFAPEFARPVGPVAAPLADAAYFARGFLQDGAPTWPNGFDIAPDWLHREMANAGALVRPAA